MYRPEAGGYSTLIFSFVYLILGTGSIGNSATSEHAEDDLPTGTHGDVAQTGEIVGTLEQTQDPGYPGQTDRTRITMDGSTGSPPTPGRVASGGGGGYVSRYRRHAEPLATLIEEEGTQIGSVVNKARKGEIFQY